jgi:hypothetical protein
LNSSESNTAPDLSISRSDVLYSPSAEHVAPGPGNMRWLAATPRRVPGVVHGPTLYPDVRDLRPESSGTNRSAQSAGHRGIVEAVRG